MIKYLEELESKRLSLLIYRDGAVIFSSPGKGIKPLIDAIDSFIKEELRGTIIVDRIVGRAAALISAYMEAAEVHAGIMSTGAMEELRRNNIGFSYLNKTPNIRNLQDSDLCPFERLVQGIHDPLEAYELIKAKLLKV